MVGRLQNQVGYGYNRQPRWAQYHHLVLAQNGSRSDRFVFGETFPKDRYAIIDGEVDSKAKARIVSEFQGGKYRFLLAQLQVSEGYTVTAADVCIYVENSYTLKDRIQSEGRILRAGQKAINALSMTFFQWVRWITRSCVH